MWSIYQHYSRDTCWESPSFRAASWSFSSCGQDRCLYTNTWSLPHLVLSRKHARYTHSPMRNENLMSAPPRAAPIDEQSWEGVKGCCSLSHDIRSTDRNSPPPLNRLLPLSHWAPSPVRTSCLQMWQNRKHFKVPPLRPTVYPDANCKCPGHSARKILNPSNSQWIAQLNLVGRGRGWGGKQTSKKAY